MSELKPCPFCGSQVAFVKPFGLYDHSVKCPACSAFGPDAPTEALAVERWNDCAARSSAPTKTLRDEFAMAALTGMACGFRTMDEWPEDLMADAAYRYADAMMQEREKTNAI